MHASASRARLDRVVSPGTVDMHITTAYRYMRIAEYRKQVLASNVRSIEAAVQLLADQPRRGHGPRRYSDADKADWVKLADEIGIKPAARALGVSSSTIDKWTSPNSPARGQTRKSREITEDRSTASPRGSWTVSAGLATTSVSTVRSRVDAAKAFGHRVRASRRPRMTDSNLPSIRPRRATTVSNPRTLARAGSRPDPSRPSTRCLGMLGLRASRLASMTLVLKFG